MSVNVVLNFLDGRLLIRTPSMLDIMPINQLLMTHSPLIDHEPSVGIYLAINLVSNIILR